MSAATHKLLNERPQRPTGERLGGSLWLMVSCGIGLLLVLQLMFAQMPQSDLDATSYGKGPQGYGALYDLLNELHFGVSRSRVAYGSLDAQRVLWVLSPNWLRGVTGVEPGEAEPRDASAVDALRAWVERGGTAVVFGDVLSDWKRLGLPATDRSPDEASFGPARIRHGTGLGKRTFKIARLLRFDASEDLPFETLIEADDAPMVVRQKLGRGQLIAVADVRLVSNAELGHEDHSLLAVDLVRAFGAPVFDEYGHDLLAVPSFMQALRPARAALLIAGLGLLLALWIWRLQQVPAERRAEPGGIDPGLSAFVDSLALLYSRMVPRHTEQIARAYREGVRHRLQRAAPRAIVARNPARATEPGGATPDPLEEAAVAPRNLSQLEHAVRAMEQRFAALAGAQASAIAPARQRRRAYPTDQEP